MSVLSTASRRFALAAVIAGGLAALTAGAAFAGDCNDGYYQSYYHRNYDGWRGNYSCYGGGYDCRYEGGYARGRYRDARYDDYNDRRYDRGYRDGYDGGRRW
jgi:hypothetical protein